MRTAILAGALLACACRRAAPPDLTDAVPSDAIAIAGIDLAALRGSPLFTTLPSAVTTVREASKVLLVWNGKDLLILASGAPSGYTPIALGITAAGSSSGIAAAQSQLRIGRTGAPGLIAHAGTGTLWAVVRGDGRLPLTGNLANLYNLLRDAEYTSLSGKLTDTLALTMTVACPTPQHAQRFEASLRAMVTVAGAASARQPDLAAQLRTIRITREDRIVHATGSASSELVGRLF
jgi:hypothetical protein